MSIPRRIKPKVLGDYLEIMTVAIFQAGLSWAVVENKWPAFRRAFNNFDCRKVAAFTSADIDRLASDESILRSRKKIAATVENARMMLDLEQEYGSFADYLHSFPSYEKLSADMRKRFKFFGELSVYYFLFRVGEPVPPFASWVETIAGEHPRMKEMVELAEKEEGTGGRGEGRKAGKS